ncbi:MAG: formylmethanofuran dehydrogenase subunit E family protein [Deferrisomatales bacterium]|nr:formylmethanofuran dehydrogenase subunit E family protein [Deferrisomatales bacterium]
MTAPTITPSEAVAPDRALFGALERLHGHRCPMSILGARMGWAARAALGVNADAWRRLRACYHHRTCAVDGIQLATQCTAGNGNLELLAEGDHRLVLTALDEGRRAEARPTVQALQFGRRYGELRSQADQLPPGSAEERALREHIAALLDHLETAPQEELAAVTLSSV